jgi:hypothetical protein
MPLRTAAFSFGGHARDPALATAAFSTRRHYRRHRRRKQLRRQSCDLLALAL